MSLLKHLANRSVRRHRILCCVDSRVLLGAVSKGPSSSRRLNFGLRRLANEWVSASRSKDLLWVPSWANPPDAPSRGTSFANWKRSFPTWPLQAPIFQFGSAAVARDLKNYSANHCLKRPCRKLGACYQTVLHETHRKWSVNKEMEGWEMGGRPELLL